MQADRPVVKKLNAFARKLCAKKIRIKIKIRSGQQIQRRL
jgi:hypothetical protein